ncbi:trypsin domain-containing protein [Ditylenchus destructor]|uniref:Trypsin domain-containing protein n=1 Tax=Ditylenchus destructor TaxID=166010 RepID=A0AAD4MSF8_9BILA|nr:trypsin domain-containing protein [Ditylenchus destructor]
MKIPEIFYCYFVLYLCFHVAESRAEYVGPAKNWLIKLSAEEKKYITEKCASNTVANGSGQRASDPNRNLIVSEADYKAYRFMAALITHSSDDSSDSHTVICGATFITPRHLLTSSSCFDKVAEKLHLWIGGECLDPSGCVGRHHSNMFEFGYEFALFDSSMVDGPAIIQLSSSAMEGGKADIICLPNLEDEIPAELTLTGWGRTANLNPKPSTAESLCKIATKAEAFLVGNDSVPKCIATFVTWRHLITTRDCVMPSMRKTEPLKLLTGVAKANEAVIEFIAWGYGHPIAIIQLLQDADKNSITPVCFRSAKEIKTGEPILNFDTQNESFKSLSHEDTEKFGQSSNQSYYRNICERSSDLFCVAHRESNASRCPGISESASSLPGLPIFAENTLQGLKINNDWTEAHNLSVVYKAENLVGAICAYLNRCDIRERLFENSLPYFRIFFTS